MLTYSDFFTLIDAHNSYFAGANTPSGFVEEYSNLFSEDSFEKIYIIKGGSGTGKSTMIKKCAALGESLGGEITHIYCSSDPDSLDGIIIKKKERLIGVIDGTAPHTKDPVYAGACGEIVNCADHWDTAILEKSREEIQLLVYQKKKSYENAYKYLAGAYDVTRMQKSLAEQCFEREKAQKAIGRISAALGGKGREGRVTYRRTSALTMKGAFRLGTYEKAERVFAVRDCAFLSPLFFEELLKALLAQGLNAEVSKWPVYGIAEIFLPDRSVSFVPYRDGGEYEKIINLRRFADRSGMAQVKNKRQFSQNCYRALNEGALESLSECKKAHFALEDIYKRAMDFSGLDQLTDQLLEKIRKKLS